MKQRLLIPSLLSCLLVSACFDDVSDIQTHIDSVKANTNNYIEPMPEVNEFHHFDYSAQDLRSPFVVPKPEAIQEKIQQMSGCLSPDPRRRKQPLEKFSLSDLTMRGTMGDAMGAWALVEASDATLHRVSIGNYLGLYNGRITEVSAKYVKVMELIPDGAGCWVERESTIRITESASER